MADRMAGEIPMADPATSMTPAEETVPPGTVRDGFLAVLPLWIGVAPFSVAFALLARDTGYSAAKTIGLSAFVFAGSAQLAIVDLAGRGATVPVIVLTVFLLNLRHLLYGMTLATTLPRPRRVPTWLVAPIVTDESFGVTIRAMRAGRGSDRFLLGASASLYACWVPCTILGALLSSRIPNTDHLHLDVIFPLSFLAILLPLIRGRDDLAVALGGAALALLLRPLIGPTNAVLATILLGSAAAALLRGGDRA